MVRLLHFAQLQSGRQPLTFNPTMVRLLRLSLAWATLYLPCFQSHNGAIATICRAEYVAEWYDLSIPQWCDCYQGKILGFEGKRKGNGEGVAVDLRLPENP